jgi:hypothetical protein
VVDVGAVAMVLKDGDVIVLGRNGGKLVMRQTLHGLELFVLGDDDAPTESGVEIEHRLLHYVREEVRIAGGR